MVKFENVTNLEDFKNMINQGKYSVEKSADGLTIAHNLYTTPYLYGLQKTGKDEYIFWAKNDEYFSVSFRSAGNTIEIIGGEKGNKKLKADRMLKQFSRILCLANSVIQLYKI